MPVVLALVLTLLVGAGVWVLVSWARGGGGCEAGHFESTRFGYCVRTPGGWTAEAAGKDGPPIDRFLVPDGVATITITAVQLSKGQDLARFEQFVRAFDEQAGGTLDASVPAEVDGVSAVAFDLAIETPTAPRGAERCCSPRTASRGAFSSPTTKPASTRASLGSTRCSERGGSPEEPASRAGRCAAGNVDRP